MYLVNQPSSCSQRLRAGTTLWRDPVPGSAWAERAQCWGLRSPLPSARLLVGRWGWPPCTWICVQAEPSPGGDSDSHAGGWGWAGLSQPESETAAGIKVTVGSPAGSVPSILTWGASFRPNPTGSLPAAAPEEGTQKLDPQVEPGLVPCLGLVVKTRCWRGPGQSQQHSPGGPELEIHWAGLALCPAPPASLGFGGHRVWDTLGSTCCH